MSAPGDEPSPPTAVFLSYAHEDETHARGIVEVLEQAGFTVWWDGLLGGGERFSSVIEAALERARAVVVLWSKTSLSSHWVHDEAARGRDRRCLVPLSIDGVEPPLGFRQFHVIDLSRAKARPDDPAMRRLINAVAALVALPAAAAADRTPRPRAGPRLDRRMLLGGGLAVAVTAAGVAFWKHGFMTDNPSAGSVAVLPFVNLSGDPNQSYFSDGLAAEVRAELARNTLLQVVAQASSSNFRDHTDDARTISRKLSVAFLLDGNVRRSGDTVRVVAELISGHTGFSKWSQTFDRPMTDVFAVQSEIAGAVVEALSAEVASHSASVGQAAPSQIGGTANVAAYDAYLRGKDLFELGADEKSDRAAVSQFEQALVIDQRYGAAQAARSRSLAVIANQYAQGADRRVLYDEAIAAANQAVSLAPELADAHSALGFALFNGHLDVRAARAPYDRSNELGSGDADVLNRFALYCARVGRSDEARAAIARATALDPLNPRVFRSAGTVEYSARRFRDAIPPVERALTLNPKMSGAWAAIGSSQLMLGKVDLAKRSFATERSSLFGPPGIAIIAAREGNTAEAQAALKRLIDENGDNSLYQQAQVYAQWNDRDRTLETLRKARAAGDAGLTMMRNDPLLDPLRNDPEFAGLQKELGFE